MTDTGDTEIDNGLRIKAPQTFVSQVVSSADIYLPTKQGVEAVARVEFLNPAGF